MVARLGIAVKAWISLRSMLSLADAVSASDSSSPELSSLELSSPELSSSELWIDDALSESFAGVLLFVEPFTVSLPEPLVLPLPEPFTRWLPEAMVDK